MAILQIQLLGEFRLVYGDETITAIHQTRLQMLLAYLLLHRHVAHSRQELAFLFWPDTSEAQARTNLRRELHHLRHGLPDAEQFLKINAKSVAWRSDAAFTLDVAHFEHRLQQADQAEQAGDLTTMRAHLERAVQLYRGKLLPDGYDDWVLLQRERLDQQLTRTLERLILILEDLREYPEAIRYAQTLLRHDPLSETTYRRLMRLHMANADRASALRVYHTCATLLQRELDVEPNQDTQDAYTHLLQMDMPLILRAQGATLLRTRSSLVGRRREWQQLRSIWRKALQGDAHCVLVAGEAGIGKTRLAAELYEAVSQQGITVAQTRSYAAEGALAYAPIIEWLRADGLRRELNKLDDVWLVELARFLPELLAQRPDLPHPAALREGWQRQRLFEALARAILIDDRPRLLLIDDLQWCDKDTLQWLHYLLRFDPTARLLIVGGVRVEIVDALHPLTSLLLDLRSSGQLTEIELGALDADHTAALATQIAGHELAPATAAQLYRETEGNPLFVVETVRAGLALSADTNEQDSLNVEPSISPILAPRDSPLLSKTHAVIQFRLAHLSTPARELARLAATIGRSFTFDVLAQASDSDEESLLRGLDELWQRRIVREQGAEGYDFSHDRIREAAYAAISPARRRVLHRRVAKSLETVHATALDAVSGQIAAHFERAGNPEQAVSYYQRAGAQAQQIYANHDACLHFRRALSSLETLPENRQRSEQELSLLIALGVPLVAAKGNADPEVQAAYVRARALCQQLGSSSSIPVLRGLASVFAVRGEVHKGYELLLELMQLAQQTQSPEHLVEAHYGLGTSLQWMGDFVSARQHLEEAISLYDLGRHREHTAQYAQDPGVVCRVVLASVLWFLGFPDRATRTGQEGLDLAYELAHPLSIAYALWAVGKLHEYLGNVSTTLTYADQMIALATEHDLPLWSSQGTVHRGWALAQLGRPAEGVVQIQAGMAAHEQTGARVPKAWHLTLLATAYGKLGKFKQALAALDEALAFAERSGTHNCDAERCRLKGELTLQLDTPTPESAIQSEAEACFLKAIGIAQSQRARSLELRAVMSLSRLWQVQGRQAEAHRMLAAIYGWFSEGFDTPDLQAAKALLEGLEV